MVKTTNENTQNALASVERKHSNSFRDIRKSDSPLKDFPRFKKPFEYGWKRRLNYRGVVTHHSNSCDIYYYAPDSSKPLRSSVEVAMKLAEMGNTDLTVDDFCYSKVCLGLNNSKYEIICHSDLSISVSRGALAVDNRNNLKKTKKSDGKFKREVCFDRSLVLKPFEFGYKRLMKVKSFKDVHEIQEICYLSPEGYGLRNFVEVAIHIANTSLKTENFSFLKSPISVGNGSEKFITKYGSKIKQFVENPTTVDEDYHEYLKNELLKQNESRKGIKRKKQIKKSRAQPRKVLKKTNDKKKKEKKADNTTKNNDNDPVESKLMEPFQYGWKRLVVTNLQQEVTKKGDIGYIAYISPDGKFCRSNKLIDLSLRNSNFPNLTLDNFTLKRYVFGINDARKEIIRPKFGKNRFSSIDSSLYENNGGPAKRANEVDNSVIDGNHDAPRTPPEKIDLNRVKQSPQSFDNSDSSYDEPTHDEEFTHDEDTKGGRSNYFFQHKTPFEGNESGQDSNTINIKREMYDSRNLSLFALNRPKIVAHKYFDISETIFKTQVKIFEYLPLKDLLRVQLVCRAWKCYSNEESLWKSISLSNIYISNWNKFVDFICIKKSSTLDLRGMLVRDEDIHFWNNFSTEIPRAKTLNCLYLCPCPSFVIDSLLNTCPNIKTLRIIKSEF